MLPRSRCLLLQAVGGWEPFAPRSTGIPRTRLRSRPLQQSRTPMPVPTRYTGSNSCTWTQLLQFWNQTSHQLLLPPGSLSPNSCSVLDVRTRSKQTRQRTIERKKQMQTRLGSNQAYQTQLPRDSSTYLSCSGILTWRPGGEKLELAESRLHGISPIPRKSGCLGIGL
jgi:hypothetical protein